MTRGPAAAVSDELRVPFKREETTLHDVSQESNFNFSPGLVRAAIAGIGALIATAGRRPQTHEEVTDFDKVKAFVTGHISTFRSLTVKLVTKSSATLAWYSFGRGGNHSETESIHGGTVCLKVEGVRDQAGGTVKFELPLIPLEHFDGEDSSVADTGAREKLDSLVSTIEAHVPPKGLF